MANASEPPPAGGGNAKYAIIGILLLLAAVGLYFMLDKEDPEPVGQMPDAGVVERSTALAEPEILIPDPEPDAGPEEDAGPPQKIVKIRYVRDTWDCSGDIPDARAVINQYRRQVRNCYERALKRNHTLQGNLNLRLRVQGNGAVSAVQVGGSLRDPETFSCVRNLANGWRFSSPAGDRCAVISVPFNFSPRE